MRTAAAALVQLVDDHMPQRFYREHPWRLWQAAAVARMADTVASMMILMCAGRAADGRILLRALYEQVVTFCWVAIDPEVHGQAWNDNAVVQLRKMHKDAERYGVTVMTPEQTAIAAAAEPMPSLIQRAHEVDAHWGGRMAGFRQPTPDDILNMQGLYLAIYRLGSRAVHAEHTALTANVGLDGYPRRVYRAPADEGDPWWSLAVPLFALALLVCDSQLNWPDAERVVAINNAMYPPR